MTQYVLANSVLFENTVLPAGKIIDSTVFDVAALQEDFGAKLLPYNATTAARAAYLDRLRLRGVQLPLEVANVVDQVSPFVDSAALGGETDEEVLTAAVGVAVLDMVYLSGAGAVDKASAADATKVAIGGVRELSGDQATVRKDGELAGFVGLTPGATYYLSTVAGQITATPPSGSGNIVQKVGVAMDATTLLLQVDRDFVVVA